MFDLADVLELRRQFPVLNRMYGDKPLTYLDNTATTQKPLTVIEAMDRFYRTHYSSVKRGVYQLSEETNTLFEATRSKVQKLIHAERTEEIIFTRGTTESINLVAASWGRASLQEGDEILISAIEHHANIVPWQVIAEEKKAVLKVIPCDDRGVLDQQEFLKLLSSRTKITAFNHISNALGTINPIAEMTTAAKKAGSLVLIDAAQSIAHTHLDVQALDCDFMAFSGHKMYGPTGIGVLYGKYDLLASMPPYQTGGEMIDRVTFEKTTFAAPPSRFETGTPAVAEVIGLGKAVDFLQETGIDNIAAWEHHLLEDATEQFGKFIQSRSAEIIGTSPDKASLISFILLNPEAKERELIHAHDAGMIYDEEAIAVRTGHHCAQPVMDRFQVPATIRASFAVYNLPEETRRLIKATDRVINLFSY